VFFLVRVEDASGFPHRSRVDIIASVLSVAVKGAKKTHIMYKCNLSFGQLQTYLGILLDRGLLRVAESGRGGNPSVFQTTAEGRAFLRAYRDLQALLSA